MIIFGENILFAVLFALLFDALFGDPDWMWRRMRHPVVWFGGFLSFFDKGLNHPEQQTAEAGRLLGGLAIALLVILIGAVGWYLQSVLSTGTLVGHVIVGLLAFPFIAQKSLYQHVRAVGWPLVRGDTNGARRAVSMIVGRDTQNLDKAGIARASIESLAENFSDGVVAPVFWFGLFGLPGLFVYKLVNTADSMIGHKTDRYQHFGWASARLDDGLNLIPARLCMLLLLFAPLEFPSGSRKRLQAVWRGIVNDAPLHRSPNAGWPEAAMAGRLDVALSGPRYYGSELVEEPFVNASGVRDVGAEEIGQALRLYRSACILEAILVSMLAISFM